MSVSSNDPGTGLRGRRRERAALDRLLDRARAGSSAVLIVRGEPGIGKTALLDYAASQAPGFRVVRAWGVESEMELAFAGLHQLCAPLLDRLQHLPRPQRDALQVAFGLREGDAPDRFLVGLAVLSLLADAAEERPFACLIDDAQWLDRASAQSLAFAARRLLAEPVLMMFAAREPGADYRGLPELVVEGPAVTSTPPCASWVSPRRTFVPTGSTMKPRPAGVTRSGLPTCSESATPPPSGTAPT